MLKTSCLPEIHTTPSLTCPLLENTFRMAFAASRMLKRGLTSFKGIARASTPAAFCKLGGMLDRSRSLHVGQCLQACSLRPCH